MTKYVVVVHTERRFVVDADTYEGAIQEVESIPEEELIIRSGGYTQVTGFHVIDTPGIDTPWEN